MTETPKIRIPQQARSRQRFDGILRALAELLEEQGYPEINVADIAARAQTSAGSLYQFFENKDAVLHALTLRYVEDFESSAATTLTAELAHRDPESIAAAVVTWIVDFKRDHPGLHHVMQNEWVSEELRAAIYAMKRRMLESISHIVAAKAPSLPESDRFASALLMMVMVDSAMPFVTGGEPTLQAQMQRELTRASAAYLKALTEIG